MLSLSKLPVTVTASMAARDLQAAWRVRGTVKKEIETEKEVEK